MPQLSEAEHYEILNDALKAAMFHSKQGVIDAVEPLFHGGDAGDGWIFLTGCIAVVASSMPVPAPGTEVSYGFAMVDPETGEVEIAQDENGKPFVPPEVEAEAPAVVSYMKILTAEIVHDHAASVQHWHEAILGGWMAGVMIHAIKQAGDTLRAQIASQN